MRRFFLSENTKFEFKFFGIQHILMILIVAISIVLFYIYRNKLKKINLCKNKKVRLVLALFIFINMIMYRFIYLYYEIYDIKAHLSLYYCHIINYLFVFSLIFNYKNFYKYIYFLSWIGFWAMLCPDLSGGIDCYIFYQFFISHNLIIILSTFILVSYNLKCSFWDSIKGLLFAICLVLITYVINYDFKTTFNLPNVILGNSIINIYDYTTHGMYVVLIFMAFLGCMLGYAINLLLFKRSD